MNSFEKALRLAIESEQKNRDECERRQGEICIGYVTTEDMETLRSLSEAIALCDERIRFAETILHAAAQDTSPAPQAA